MSYKENSGKATPTPVTPEMERVKRNQENISSVFLCNTAKALIPKTYYSLICAVYAYDNLITMDR